MTRKPLPHARDAPKAGIRVRRAGDTATPARWRVAPLIGLLVLAGCSTVRIGFIFLFFFGAAFLGAAFLGATFFAAFFAFAMDGCIV